MSRPTSWSTSCGMDDPKTCCDAERQLQPPLPESCGFPSDRPSSHGTSRATSVCLKDQSGVHLDAACQDVRPPHLPPGGLPLISKNNCRKRGPKKQPSFPPAESIGVPSSPVKSSHSRSGAGAWAWCGGWAWPQERGLGRVLFGIWSLKWWLSFWLA